MKKKQVIQKAICGVLAAAMVATSMPAEGIAGLFAQEVQAAEAADDTVGASPELLDQLNFTGGDIPLGEEDANPYTAGVGKGENLSPISEVLLTYRDSSTSPERIYNEDLYPLSTGLGLNLGWYNGEAVSGFTDKTNGLFTGTNASKQSTEQSSEGGATGSLAQKVCALDTDGDGYQDVYVTMDLALQTSRLYYQVRYYVNDISTGDRIGSNKVVCNKISSSNETIKDTFFSLTAGDFDGDGCDEVAMFTPSETVKDGVNQSNINIYEVSKENGIGKSILSGGAVTVTSLEEDTVEDVNLLGANTKVPIVELETVNMDGDVEDELAITVTHEWQTACATAWGDAGAYFAVVGIDSESSTLETYHEQRLNWTGEDYELSKLYDTAGIDKLVVQFLHYVGMTNGDMDNDGLDELILAGYNASGHRANGWMAGIMRLTYSGGKYRWLDGGLPYIAQTAGFLLQKVDTSRRIQPLEVCAFAAHGMGFADSLFLEGKLYEYNSENVADWETTTSSSLSIYFTPGMLSTTPLYYAPTVDKAEDNGSLKKLYQARWHSEVDEEVLYPTEYNTGTKHAWVTNVISGNFNGNKYGMEQIICVIGRVQDTEDVLCDYTITGLSASVVGNANHKWLRSMDRNFMSGKPINTSRVTLCALDSDRDGMMVSYKGKDSFFSDPNVVAVLQAAPYFKDLESVDGDYISNGSTSFGKSKGSGTSVNNDFSVSAGVVTGFSQDISLFGFYDIGGIDLTIEASVSAGYSNEVSTAKTYSTTYESSSTNNSVVLSTTPYVRYNYDMYVPEYKLMTKTEYNTLVNTTLPDVLANYNRYKERENTERMDYYANKYNNLLDQKDAIEKAIASGEYTYGETIPAHTEDYSICIPQTPRMTMISTKQYDKIAAVTEGLDVIEGNILTNTPGDPYSYPASIVGSGYDGGQVVGDVSGSVDGFLRVGTGNSVSTQEIVEETSESDSVTWGVSASVEYVAEVGGVKAGYSIGTDYSGGYTWTDFNSSSYSGSVASIPEDENDEDLAESYVFSWRFGSWNAKLNGSPCKVLGYTVKELQSPPSLPENVSVLDATPNTIELGWDTPRRKGAQYEVAILESNGNYMTVDIVPSKEESYVIDNDLLPGRTYQVAMRSIGRDKTVSAWSLPQAVRTKNASGSDAPSITEQPTDKFVWENENAVFEVVAIPVAGSSTTISRQWQMRTSSDERWQDIAGATNARYECAAVTSDMEGYQYRCVISQSYGGEMRVVDSAAATLHIKEKLATTTTLAPFEKSTGESGTEIQLKAAVSDTAAEAALTTGTIDFHIENTTKGTSETKSAAVGEDGTASVDWTPSGDTVYQIRAEYTGNDIYAVSTSEAQKYFSVLSISTGAVLSSVEAKDTVSYGSDLELTAMINTILADGDIKSDTVGAQITWRLKKNSTDAGTLISVTNGVWSVSALPGEYYIEGTFTTGSTQYAATHRVTVTKASLTVKVPDKTIDVNTEDTDYVFDNSEVVLEGVFEADRALVMQSISASVNQEEILLDAENKPLNDTYTISVSYAENVTKDTIEALQKKYNIYFQEAALTYTGNVDAYYTLKVTEGEGGTIPLAQVVTPNDAKVKVQSGNRYELKTKVSLSANPKDAYRFIGWMENGVIIETSRAYDFELTEDRDIVAAFELIQDQLVSVPTPADLNVSNISAADIVNQLPDKVSITTRDNTETEADVANWDVTGFYESYSENVVSSNSYVIPGTIILPDGIGNSNEVSLTTSITINVTPDALTLVTAPEAITVGQISADEIYEKLPTEVEITTREGFATSASVTWNRTDITEQLVPYMTQAQQLTIAGTVELPSKVSNSNNVSLTTFITVNVAQHDHTVKTTMTPAGMNKAGNIEERCSVCNAVVSNTPISAIASVSLSKTSYTYNGKAQSPAVTVKDASGKVISSSNYTVKYAAGRKNPGKYTVTVTFKGNYTGTVSSSFSITVKLSKVTGVSVKAAAKGFTAKWKKSASVSGYELQYSTSKNFKKAVKNVTLKKASLISKKVTRLSAKKKYYVRIRSYKTIAGKKYYSDWTAAKAVTTKKK